MSEIIRITKGSGMTAAYSEPDGEGFYLPQGLDRNALKVVGDQTYIEYQPDGFELHYEPPDTTSSSSSSSSSNSSSSSSSSNSSSSSSSSTESSSSSSSSHHLYP